MNAKTQTQAISEINEAKVQLFACLVDGAPLSSIVEKLEQLHAQVECHEQDKLASFEFPKGLKFNLSYFYIGLGTTKKMSDAIDDSLESLFLNYCALNNITVAEFPSNMIFRVDVDFAEDDVFVTMNEELAMDISQTRLCMLQHQR